MEELLILFDTVLNRDFIRGIISNPRSKGGIVKVKIRPLELRGQLVFQFESFTAKQAFHKNLEHDAALRELAGLSEQFRQIQMETADAEYTVLISKKGRASIKKKQRKGKAKDAELSHNRQKHYILEEGKYVPFLHDLGVMTEDGRIIRSRTDKFRQINRFLEFIEDILPQLDRHREVTILDFGCGKSYLTFAMYYYLHELKGYDIRIIGLDLKEDVIRHCSRLAEKYGYDKLTFLTGDIADYEGTDQVDMVVTLHACDTATDYALAKAIRWKAKVILSVPCCQHELNMQLSADTNAKSGDTGVRKQTGGGYGRGFLAPVMDYGLLRERFAALVTDGLRAKYLERAGYETQVLEFIDMEHTPKNILLRAVRRKGNKNRAADDIVKCEEFLQVAPALGHLLSDIEGE